MHVNENFSKMRTTVDTITRVYFMANILRYPLYPLRPVNAFFDRSLNALSVSYTVHIRFVRYTPVTRPLVDRSFR